MSDHDEDTLLPVQNPIFEGEFGPVRGSVSDNEGNESVGWDFAATALGGYVAHELSGGNPLITVLGMVGGETLLQGVRALSQHRKRELLSERYKALSSGRE